MKNRIPTLAVLLALIFALTACGSGGSDSTDQSASGEVGGSSGQAQISGQVQDGLRVLTFDPSLTNQDFRIYRGDYVRPEIKGGGNIHLVIEDLKVDGEYPAPEGSKPYFKVPGTGTFSYQAGNLTGVIEAVDYTAASYQEVSAKEAVALIANIDPLILDVRTDREFNDGHIEDALLIPVQVLQVRVGELAEYKDRTIFIYCRSGNRSTVASRMLIDKEFKQVVNLRHGVNDWNRSGYKLVK